MNKIMLVTVMLAIAITSCAGGQAVKTEAPVEGSGSGFMVNQMNEQLAKVPYEGFGYKSADVPSHKYDKWATAAAPVIKEVISKLPEGYVFQVTGHTDNTGPENAEKGRLGNVKLSEKRAKAVYDALKRKGVKSPKMTYKGVGSSMPKDGVPGDDATQRRVTFQVVEK